MKVFISYLFMLFLFVGCFNKAEETAQDSLVSGHKKVTNTFEVSTNLNRVYKLGNTIRLEARHPFTLILTGTPSISLDIGGTSRQATYVSGANSKTLIFEYTVQAGDNDTDGIEISDTINLNGGTLQFANKGQGVNAHLQFKSLSTSNVRVDTKRPSITSVTVVSNRLYKVNEKIPVTVNFDEKVYITGTPRVKVRIGAQERYATYKSGHGKTKLVFEYTTVAADLDTNGIEVLTPVELNSGTIKDTNNLNAILTFTSTTAPNSTTVDGGLAFITSVNLPVNKTYGPGEKVTFQTVFSEDVNVTGTPQIAFDLGGNARALSYTSGSGTNTLTFEYTVIAGEEDTDGILIAPVILIPGATIQDDDSKNAELTFSPVLTPGVIIDATLPKVTSIVPPNPGSYKDGESLTFSLVFNRVINVTGAPRIDLRINSNNPTPNYADYISGSGTNALIFRYVVKATDADLDGVSVENNILLNGGEIKDANLTHANLSLAAALGAINLSTVIIDNNAADITAVTAPANKDYRTGENIDFTVQYNQNVDVTNTPRLQLTIGSTTRYADYLSGTGTSNLVFRYPVIAADNDTDGISLVSTTIDLNSTGTIRKAGSASNAKLDFSAHNPNLSAVLVNAIAGAVAITTPSDNSYINIANNSSTFTVSGTCNLNGNTVNILVGGSNAAAQTGFICDGTNFTGTIDTTGITEGAFQLKAQLDIGGGNSVDSTDINITKDITAPTIQTVTVPANKTYKLSEDLDFTINTNENITVTGSPQLALTIGSNTRNPSYISGTGSQNLLFRYTVAAADEDTDGVVLGTSLDLNSGTLTDTAGNPLNLDLTITNALPSLAAVLVDGIIPTVAITTADNITGANQSTYSIIGSCSENGENVVLNIGSINKTVPCIGGAWTSGSTDVSTLGDSPSISITADHSDLATNAATQAQTTVSKETSTPVVTLNTPSNIDNTNKTSYGLSGTCTENGRDVTIAIGSLNFTSTCSSGNWSLNNEDVSSLADNASISITVDHTDGTTPAPQVTASISKDTVSATVKISSAANINASNENTYTVTGTCSVNGQAVTVDVGGVSVNRTCNSGAWSSGPLNVSGLADSSSITVTVDHQGAQDTKTITKNTSTPTMSSLSVSSTLKDSVDLVWTINEPVGFTINDYEINYRVKNTPTWLPFSDGVSTNKTATVSGLNASTTYELRVRLQYDSSNYSDWSPIAEGTTKPDNPLFDGPNKAMNVGGATESKVVAYNDNTRVYLNGSEIPESPLSKGQVVQFNSSQFDVIDADKPIYTAGRRGSGGNTSKANITWMPTSWAGRSFTLNSIRDNPQQLHVYAIENATITIKQGSTTLATDTVTAGNGTVLSWNTYGSYQISATGTILAFHTSGNPASRLVDPKPLLPVSQEIIGFPSNSMRLTTSKDGTNYTALHSNSATASNVLSKSDSIQINPNAGSSGSSSLYRSHSTLISADQGVSGASYADSNGNCAAPFLPTSFMKKKYMINTDSNWVAFASKNPGSIQVLDSAGNVTQTLTLARTGGASNAPYYVRIGTTSGGVRFNASVPVAAWYEPNNDNGGAIQDETILYGFND